MDKLLEIWRKTLFLLRRDRFNREMDEEMQFHLEMKIEEYLAAGMSAEEARTAAYRQFGNAPLLRERSRAVWGYLWLETLLQDLRYGLRMMLRTPGFTLVALLSLALGIGANTAIFTLLDTVLLKQLPVTRPEELVLLKWYAASETLPAEKLSGNVDFGDGKSESTSTSFSYPIFTRLRAECAEVTDLFGFAELDKVNASIEGQAQMARAQVVTGNYYDTLGVAAAIGRTINVSDDQPGSSQPVAMISYNYWQNRFGGDNSVLGKTVYINSSPFTIIGVTPRGFNGTVELGLAPEFTIPTAFMAQVEREQTVLTDNEYWWMQIIGRRRAGVTEAKAKAVLGAAFQRIVSEAQTGKKEPVIPRLELQSGSQGLTVTRDYLADTIYILAGIFTLVLLIACVNVANLFLARASARTREIAVRMALGASRARLIRQLITESLLISLAGGIIGLLLAFGGVDLLIAAFPIYGGDALALELSPDYRALLFTLSVSLITGLLFGLLPAVKASKPELVPALKESALSGQKGSRSLLNRVLVVSQVALALLMLVAAGLFVRTLDKLKRVDLGFEKRSIILFTLTPSLNGYQGEKLKVLYEEIRTRIEALPGVTSIGLARNSFMGGSGNITTIKINGQEQKPNGKRTFVFINAISDRFFQTMGMPILRGRNFNSSDTGNSARVAIVNEKMIRTFFNGENPIGKRFTFGGANDDGVEIVGIVKDVKIYNLRDEVMPTAYFPFLQAKDNLGTMSFAVRTDTNLNSMVMALRQTVSSIDSNLPLSNVKTQEEQINRSILQETQFARLTSFFGLLALFLACIGLYGLVSYTVNRRTQEIGVRMALGARPADILYMVIKESLVLIVIGLVVGIVAALAATRLIESLLFGISPTDPVTIAAVSLLLFAITLLAGYMPARRAARIDPMIALRHE